MEKNGDMSTECVYGSGFCYGTPMSDYLGNSMARVAESTTYKTAQTAAAEHPVVQLQHCGTEQQNAQRFVPLAAMHDR